MDTAHTLPLSLKQRGLETPVLTLGGIDITRFVARDGLQIEYKDDLATVGNPGIAVPTVTITFGFGALDLDFDVDLLENLLADARTKAAR